MLKNNNAKTKIEVRYIFSAKHNKQKNNIIKTYFNFDDREIGLTSNEKLFLFQKNQLYLDSSDYKIFELSSQQQNELSKINKNNNMFELSICLCHIYSLWTHLKDELIKLNIILKNHLCRFCKVKLSKHNTAKYKDYDMRMSMALDNVCTNKECIQSAQQVCRQKLKCNHWCNGM